MAMEQTQYDRIHRIGDLARQLCIKRNHAAGELVKVSDDAWENLFDLVAELGNKYMFRKPKMWCNRHFTGCGIVKQPDGTRTMMFYPHGMIAKDRRGNDAFSYDHEILFLLSITDHIVAEISNPK